MLKYGKLTGMVILFFSMMSCGSARVWVTGKVQRVMGNQMPSPDAPNEDPAGFQTAIYFFEPTLMNMGTPSGERGIYMMDNKKLVAKVLCEANGQFKVKLKPGKYSVLLGKDGQYYSNISDLTGLINPVEVSKKDNKPLVLRADWDAIY